MIEAKGSVAAFVEEYDIKAVPARHPSLFELRTLLFGSTMGLLGIIIGLELLTRVGITPNTSIIAALITIAVSRIPAAVFRPFKDLSRQNLMQTIISAATFGGANAVLLPLGVLWLYGRIDLIPAMMLGAFLGLLIDATILYGVFDSRIYPAAGIWPSGIATAECLIAGDRGGKRGILLALGSFAGGIGRYFGLPMDIFGVCWIGNVWALTMFAAGLLIRGYSMRLLGADINALYVPHGIMIGAGFTALLQIASVIARRAESPSGRHGISGRRFGQTLGGGFAAFIAAAAVMAVAAGLYGEMSPAELVGFIIFAAFAAVVSELIVGISAMHAGWFPAFATALIFLVLGMVIGFPPVPLAFLVGFTASTGPAFADMGYDFKTGWIIRGKGKHPEFERQGRRQQYLAALLGFAVAGLVVFFFHERYFSENLFPPVDRVFAATIQAGAAAGIGRQLLIWAVPGAVVQLLGGPSRQIGILLATGLLIENPTAGWTAAVALAVRSLLLRHYGKSVESPMYVLAGGFIAGSALTSFGAATLSLRPYD